MTSLDLGLILGAVVLLSAIAGWTYVRSRGIAVKIIKIEFGREQLKFGHAQLAFAQEQHRDMVDFRKRQMRSLGNLPQHGFGLGGPREGGEGTEH